MSTDNIYLENVAFSASLKRQYWILLSSALMPKICSSRLMCNNMKNYQHIGLPFLFDPGLCQMNTRLLCTPKPH